jgi:uncharacterized protein
MARPRKPRICICPHRAGYSAVFKPAGTPLKDMDIIHLAQDELEVLHLCDGEGNNQIEAGISMGVSRGTVQRLLAGARSKVVRALVGQKTLAISGAVPVEQEITVSGDSVDQRSSRSPPAERNAGHL